MKVNAKNKITSRRKTWLKIHYRNTKDTLTVYLKNFMSEYWQTLLNLLGSEGDFKQSFSLCCETRVRLQISLSRIHNKNISTDRRVTRVCEKRNGKKLRIISNENLTFEVWCDHACSSASSSWRNLLVMCDSVRLNYSAECNSISCYASSKLTRLVKSSPVFKGARSRYFR